MPVRRGTLRWTLLTIAGLLAGSPSQVTAQAVARASVEENFRREPSGVVLARVVPGVELRVLSTEGDWTEVELGGWVWLQSVEPSDDPTFDLAVAASGGENLRATPGGDIVARVEEGALLGEAERNPSWARVTRRGWIWSASIDVEGVVPPGPMIQPEAPGFDAGPSSRRPIGFAAVGAAGGAILTAPDGDTLALATAGGDLQVVNREGNWVRVRVEGWMWMPEAEVQAEPVGDAAALEPDDLAREPRQHNGRVVAWALQFISLERAEAVRTDFFQGEPFLLTRFGGPEGPFVYVAVPPDRLAEVDGLVPLERISVTARIRTGASALTDTPIIDLLSIERSREAP